MLQECHVEISKKNWPAFFALTRKRDAWGRTPTAWQNPGATKIPLPLRAGDKNRPLNNMQICSCFIDMSKTFN